jgi:hypothetical protein
LPCIGDALAHPIEIPLIELRQVEPGLPVERRAWSGAEIGDRTVDERRVETDDPFRPLRSPELGEVVVVLRQEVEIFRPVERTGRIVEAGVLKVLPGMRSGKVDRAARCISEIPWIYRAKP